MVNNANTAKSGFNFENFARNKALEAKGAKPPKATSTGTTIVGVIYKGGVCLGADTRATEGPIVADKNCEKIHYIAPNIYCCGAGTAADTEFTTNLISSQIELHSLATGRQPRTVTVMTMLKQMLFKYQGQIGAALVVGGFDATGSHLYTVYPHGSTDKLPYVTMGSGSLAAMSVFESQWRPDMTREEAIAIVSEAIEAGISMIWDLASNVDVCVIEKDSTDYLRTTADPTSVSVKERQYKYARGTTAILKESIQSLVQVTEGDAMDISL